MNNTNTDNVFQNFKNSNDNFVQSQREKNKLNALNNLTQNNKFQESILDMNEKLRTDIKLSLAIYKKINNFEHNYIHNIFNGN